MTRNINGLVIIQFNKPENKPTSLRSCVKQNVPISFSEISPFGRIAFEGFEITFHFSNRIPWEISSVSDDETMRNKLVSSIICVLIFLLSSKYVEPIKCPIGWGQRGLKNQNGIAWSRTCPAAHYCFEAVTTDVQKVITLIDYPWDPYYDVFYIKGCGGEFGTPLQIHPYRGKPYYYRIKTGFVKINITTEHIVTGQGGTEIMDVEYICRTDMCNSKTSKFI